MPDDLVIARNPDADSSLPYLVRIPLGPNGIILKVRDTWPRTTKVYCHRAKEWPAGPEIVERQPVRSVSRRGAAIDLVLERARENRSQFVMTRARGREMIFWQSRRTAKQARPNVTLPIARAHGHVVDIVVDTGEKYAFGFRHQQATTSRRRLPAGDYAIFDGDELIASVERKSIADLSSGLLSGKLTYQLADLAALHRGAVVVESSYSKLFKNEYVSGASLAEQVAEAQVRFPAVPIVFCDTRGLAEEWTYRWLGAARHEWVLAKGTEDVLEPLAGPAATPAEIRAWAMTNGLDVLAKGRIPARVREAWEHRNDPAR
ncbi:ERCC4 domain-containing protein [Gordonia rhizosphera]|uniref:ERCC4 domain-containing protein n=1 Tax=Gordonia rhizosphera NBRC 16068 TaxID=1108045 RepID=K6WNG3_9ACTN|nr:ERCC4 domain-containing protein [Gordonia rhizosphera]GAB88084.1 hypothetical protein GORHZ_001_00160 [Gordonia rhizosphera NBRC 16068]